MFQYFQYVYLKSCLNLTFSRSTQTRAMSSRLVRCSDVWDGLHPGYKITAWPEVTSYVWPRRTPRMWWLYFWQRRLLVLLPSSWTRVKAMVRTTVWFSMKFRDHSSYGFGQWEGASVCAAFSQWSSLYPEWLWNSSDSFNIGPRIAHFFIKDSGHLTVTQRVKL